MDGRPRSGARELFESICVAVVLALFVRTFVFQTFKIPSGSMEETLLIGDHLIVDKFGARPIARGQVVVFKSPEQPATDLIKRVIGLPGETVELRGRTVYVDGQPLTGGHLNFEPQRGQATQSGGMIKDGKFDVTEEAGAAPGLYSVAIFSGASWKMRDTWRSTSVNPARPYCAVFGKYVPPQNGAPSGVRNIVSGQPPCSPS